MAYPDYAKMLTSRILNKTVNQNFGHVITLFIYIPFCIYFRISTVLECTFISVGVTIVVNNQVEPKRSFNLCSF